MPHQPKISEVAGEEVESVDHRHRLQRTRGRVTEQMSLRSEGLRVAVHPHSSSPAHAQIPKLVLYKQFVCQKRILLFVFIHSFVPVLNTRFVLYTAIAFILHKEDKNKSFHTSLTMSSEMWSQKNLSEFIFI